MIRKAYWGFLIAGALFVGGCGGAKPTAFSSESKPLAQSALNAVEQKDLSKIKLMMDLVKKRKKLTSAEIAVFTTVSEYAESGDWSSAQSLLESSLEISVD